VVAKLRPAVQLWPIIMEYLAHESILRYNTFCVTGIFYIYVKKKIEKYICLWPEVKKKFGHHCTKWIHLFVSYAYIFNWWSLFHVYLRTRFVRVFIETVIKCVFLKYTCTCVFRVRVLVYWMSIRYDQWWIQGWVTGARAPCVPPPLLFT
jgi:hypothetical protein